MAQYLTGTVSTTAGSATITGVDTLWLVNVQAGNEIKIGDDPVFYVIGAVASDTSLTLTAPYPATVAGEDYLIVNDFTGNVGLPLLNSGDLNSPEIFTRAMQIIDTQLNYAPLTFVANVQSILSTPPGSPASGAHYLVGAAATGDWTGKGNNVALWGGAAWTFTAPAARLLAYNIATGAFMTCYYDALATAYVWAVLPVSVASRSLGNFELALPYEDVLEVTAAGNVDRMQHRMIWPRPVRIAFAYASKAGMDATANSGGTTIVIGAADYSEAVPADSISVVLAYNARYSAPVTTGFTLAANTPLFIYVDAANGGHADLNLILGVQSL